MRKNLTPQQLLQQILSDNFQSRFWVNVQVNGPDECWPWTGAKISGGYGRSYLPKSGDEYAHRAAWMTANKIPIPEDKPFILHSCIGNPACCNPYHLRAGTPQENTDDMIRQGRDKLVNPMKGEQNGRAKITPEQVIAIRNMHVPRKVSYPKIARMFGLNLSTVQRIIHRELWPHI